MIKLSLTVISSCPPFASWIKYVSFLYIKAYVVLAAVDTSAAFRNLFIAFRRLVSLSRYIDTFFISPPAIFAAIVIFDIYDRYIVAYIVGIIVYHGARAYIIGIYAVTAV